MTEYIEPTAPPEYAGPKTGEVRSAPDSHVEQPPFKAQKHDVSSYPPAQKPGDAFSQYETIDFLGNVSGGPHAAAAEALATFSSSVGDGASSGQQYVPMPPPVPAPAPQQQAPAHTPAPAQGPPFICPTCNTSYSRLEYLRRHERRHADIRPFVCPCGKSFSRSDVLARHKTKCRVVLASDNGERKGERTRGTQRQARPRSRNEGRRSLDSEEVSDISVDPALAPVDPSLPPAPPPPLENAGEGDQYALGYHHYEGEYAPKGVPVHYGRHEKVYPTAKPAPRSSSYVSGPGAIHPELSARPGMYPGSQGEHSYAPQAYAPGHYTPPEPAQGRAPQSAPNSAAFGINDPNRYSVPGTGSLSPFSNTALNSGMSPYLSAFSCARDTPHSGRGAPADKGSERPADGKDGDGEQGAVHDSTEQHAVDGAGATTEVPADTAAGAAPTESKEDPAAQDGTAAPAPDAQ